MKKQTWEEFLNSIEEKKIVDYKNPSCNNCVDCCGGLSVISQEEYKKLLKLLKTPQWKSQFQGAKSRLKKRNEVSKDTLDLRCPFQHNGRCTIYSIRPQVCREFHCSPSLNKWDLDKFIKEYPDHVTILNLFDIGLLKK